MTQTEPQTKANPDLKGAFLIVEDELMVAMRIEEQLIEVGATVVVTCADVQEALTFIAGNAVAFALLDFRLARGETSAPVAAALQTRGCPFALLSGLGTIDQLPETLKGMPILSKPVSSATLRAHLLDLGCLVPG